MHFEMFSIQINILAKHTWFNSTCKGFYEGNMAHEIMNSKLYTQYLNFSFLPVPLARYYDTSLFALNIFLNIYKSFQLKMFSLKY